MFHLQPTDRVWSADPVRDAPPFELTVVIPTLNERPNVAPLIRRLELALVGVSWQAIFVDDDSADGTAEAVKAIARDDRRISCLHRVGRTGLSGAAIEGMLASSAPFVALIDGDLQHDERLLPRMLSMLKTTPLELVVASRYIGAGSASEGFSPTRGWASRTARRMGAAVVGRRVSDPVSGFFMTRREVVAQSAPRLWTGGFKVLFDLVARQGVSLRIAEVPYGFRPRLAGDSKFSLTAAVDYALLVFARGTGVDVPLPVLKAGLVALAALLLHAGLLGLVGVGGQAGELLAAGLSVAGAAAIGGLLVGRDRQRSAGALAAGLALAGLGVGADLAVAHCVQDFTRSALAGGMAGGLTSSVWLGVVMAAGARR